MSREQMEEMAKVLCDACQYSDRKCENIKGCAVEGYAVHLYNEGYRRQSEVAKEIFEEITSCIEYVEQQLDSIPDSFAAIKEDIYVLKNKYVKGE